MIGKKLKKLLIISIILLSMIPLHMVNAAVSVGLAPAGPYVRGDTITITTSGATASEDFYIQVKYESGIKWVDQDVFSGANYVYTLKIPDTWYGGVYTVTVKASTSGSASTTFVLNAPTPTTPIITVPPPTVPTVATIQAMTNAEAAETISKLQIKTAAQIMTGLTTSKAVAVIRKLNNSFVISIFEAAVDAGNTSDVSRIFNALDEMRAGDLLLGVGPEAGASIVENMVGQNLNAAALRVEEAVKRSGNQAKLTQFGGTLVGVPAQTLVSLFREIVGLPATPSTVASLFEVMPITKVIDIVDAWMETEDYEGLATVFSYLSEEKIDEIYLTMSASQRTALYTYLDEATQAKLPEPGELTVSNLTITPSTVQIGEVVTIKVTVENDGLIQLSQGVTLKVAGTSIESEMVTLMPGNSQTLTWTVSETTPGTYSVNVNGLTGSFTVEAAPIEEPAHIVYNSISVSPSSVVAGSPVTVTVTLENTGDLSGIESVEFSVDYVTEDIKDVTVAGGATQTTTFTVTKDVAGTYTVGAGGKTATFTVTEPPQPPPSQFPWIYVIAAVVVIAIGAFFYMRRQSQ